MKTKEILIGLSLFLSLGALADNPLVTHMYTADPTARVINGKLFVFPSSDIDYVDSNTGNNGFLMPYYHIFSTENMMDWQDHGKQIDQNDVPWGEKDSYAMWAPDCIEKDGKFYYYYPAQPKGGTKTHYIGVAVASNPEGPYTLEKKPMKGVVGIDPNAFIDDDGTAYLYWSASNNVYGCKLKPNMKEIDGEPVLIQGLPKEYKEAPFVFKKEGMYYITFSQTTPYRFCELAYGISQTPLGVCDYKGAFMKNWADLWTNHHSFVRYEGEWILFYHHHDISKKSRLRSICADYISFNNDGSIAMLHPTERGIGVCNADREIQIDRHSEIAPKATTVKRIGNKLPAAWQVTSMSSNQPTWIRYNNVYFGDKKYSDITVKCMANAPKENMKLIVRENGFFGKVIATVSIPATRDWNEVTVPINYSPKEKVDLVCFFEGEEGYSFSIDWIKFK